MALMRGFKRHIAAEIEVFLSAVFLRMLASPASSHEQKMNVLAAFRSMCTEPGSVLEMFLNYDCTEGRQNVFEDSVRVLASIAQGRSPASEGDSQNAADKAAVEAAQIKAASMQALSAVLSSIVLLADAAAKQMNETQGAGELDIGGTGGASAASETTSGEEKVDDGEAAELAALRAESSRGSIASPTSSTTTSSSSHPLSSSAALAKSYDEQKKRRALLEKAAVKFSVKPKKGIEYMQASGLCGDTPQAIAAIFHELKDVLDKTSIGEYMGEEKAQNVQTLHAYIDMIDFEGLTYDDAVRKFLSGFRLPGEAQKIDRMMEKFAERYCNCNPGVFPTADTAFILAYSIIMLHTDAHNPNIKPEKKMSKENFLKNNRGIANGADLPGEFLGAIYDSIRTRPFTLREDDALRAKVAPTQVDERTRQAQLAAERQMIVSQGHAAMSTARKQSTARLLAVAAEAEAAAAAGSSDGQGGTEPSPAAAAALIADLGLSYYSVQDVLLADHVRPMFDVTWGALLATFSVNFEAAGETPEGVATVEACLLGFNQAIHVAGQLKLDQERDMLVSSLCKFTMLEQSQSSAAAGAGLIKEFRGKHIAAMRALLSMTFNEGHNLGASWGPVLVCVSLLARLVNVSAGGKEDAHFFKAPATAASQQQVAGSNSSAARREAERLRVAIEKDMQTERLNAAIVGAHIHEADLTRLYLRSVALPTDAIVHFVTQLAAVSIQELSGVVAPVADFPSIGGGTSQRHARGILPRVFSLQKVVEVADFNMDVRPRMAWARVWDTLSRFFTAVCCSSNTGVAMFAIDSLKQLALKFMAKPELKSFSFQGKFLYPFLTIMEATSPAALAVARTQAKNGNQSNSGSTPTFLQPSPEIRELILHVCANIIRARHGNTRSGWRSLLGVYAAAASDTSEVLVSFAFSTANEIVTQHFDAVVASGAFVDAIKCMVAFGSNVHTIYALRAIDHCTTLGAHLARGHVPLENDVNNSSSSGSGSALSTQDSSASSCAVEVAITSALASSDEFLDWYDLESKENDDVIDNARDRALLSKLKSSVYNVSSSNDGNEQPDSSTSKSVTSTSAYLMSGEAESDYASSAITSENSNGLDGDDSTKDILLHENATDVAIMLADDVKGGKIRRLNDSKAIMQLLWPLLTGLGGLISSDSRLKIRMRALSSLFLFLRRYGPGFTPELWSLIYGGVLLPIFDDVRHAGDNADDEVVVMAVNALQDQKNRGANSSPSLSSDLEGGELSAPHFSLSEFSSRSIPNPSQIVDVNSLSRAAYWPAKKKALSAHTVVLAKQLAAPIQQDDEHEWLRTTCLPALSSLVKVQSRFFKRLHFLLPALLRLIEACVDQEIEGLARIGVASLRLLLADAGSMFETETWTIVCSSLARLFRSCTPIALQEARKHLLGKETFDPVETESAEVNIESVLMLPSTSTAVSASIDTTVSTLYGPGVLLVENREGDGAFVVRLAWSTLYTFSNPSRVSSSVSSTASVAPVLTSTHTRVLPSASIMPAAQLSLPFNAQRVVTQCVVQLELIGCAGVLADAHLSSLKMTHVDELLSLLQGSAEFARKFNGDRKLRKALWERGFMRFAKHNKLPSLLRQESTATQQLLILLLRLYKHRDEATVGSLGTVTPWRDLSVRHLVSLIKGVLVRYTQLAIDVERAVALAVPPHMQVALQSPTVTGSGIISKESASSTSSDRDELLVGDHSKDLFREAAAYAPIVLQLLDGVLSFDNDEFKENLSWLYPLLTGLITCGSVEIRLRLRNVFEGRLKAMLPI
jgi:Sec7-like guanine-nucleotide exchange factor